MFAGIGGSSRSVFDWVQVSCYGKPTPEVGTFDSHSSHVYLMFAKCLTIEVVVIKEENLPLLAEDWSHLLVE